MPICLSNPFMVFSKKPREVRNCAPILELILDSVALALARDEMARDEMANNEGEKPAAAPPTPGLSPVKMVLGLVVLLGLNYVFTDLLDESVCCSSPPCLLVHAHLS